MQEIEQAEILRFANITRPFYVVDISAPDAQLIIFLDESAENPILYQIMNQGRDAIDDGFRGQRTLKSYIEEGIEAYKRGDPVF